MTPTIAALEWAWPAWLQMTPEKLEAAHAHGWYSLDVVAWLYMDATHVSAQLHRMQRRKDEDATPYINHPVAVAHLMLECGVTCPSSIAAGLLHDTIEDTGATRQQLQVRYGPAVAGMVEEVSDDKALPKQARKELQIAHAPHLSVGAKAVKLADKTRNLEDVLSSPPPGWSTERRLQYFDWAAAVVEGLRGPHPQLEARFDAVYQRRGELEVARPRESRH